MRFVSFNINGIRAHTHQLFSIIDKHKPDFIGLQEIKVDDKFFPVSDFINLGYEVYFYGQKSYNGVAFFSKKKVINVIKGFPDEKNDLLGKRIIICDILSNIGKITLINIYSPQGDRRDNKYKFLSKQIFYKKLINYVNKNFTNVSNVIIMGDFNISISDYDIGIGEKNKNIWLNSGKCSFLPEERFWINNLISFGFTDTFRENNKYVSDKFSWFDYRSNGFKKNKGLRIDLILVSNCVFKYCTKTGIDYTVRNMVKPSDHAPIWADFSFF